MQILSIPTKLLNTSQLDTVLTILRAGGVIVYPTDTSYGIGCDATNPRAVKKIFHIKQRPAEKKVSVMVSGIPMAKRYGQWNGQAQQLAQQYWPGALTIVLKKKGRGTVGMRAPKHALALQIVKAYNKPIVTTSANISGQSPCYSISVFLQQLRKSHGGETPDYILNTGALRGRTPSTVVDARTSTLVVLRKGSIRIEC